MRDVFVFGGTGLFGRELDVVDIETFYFILESYMH